MHCEVTKKKKEFMHSKVELGCGEEVHGLRGAE